MENEERGAMTMVAYMMIAAIAIIWGGLMGWLVGLGIGRFDWATAILAALVVPIGAILYAYVKRHEPRGRENERARTRVYAEC